MKDFEDVRIIALRREEQRKKFINVQTGMYIKNYLYTFEETPIAVCSFSMMIPVGFMEMEEHERKKKFPSEERPEVIIGNQDGDTIFTFSNLETWLPPKELASTAGVLRTLIKSANPAVVFLKEGKIQHDTVTFHWFDFKSYTLNGSIYNFLVFITSKKRTVLGMFSCPYELGSDWNAVYLQQLETFYELGEDGYEGR